MSDRPTLRCQHCDRARAGVGCGYQLHPAPCSECVARSVARSLVTFEAVKTRDTAELRETLARVLPALPFERSSAMVREWWQMDHKRRTTTQGI